MLSFTLKHTPRVKDKTKTHNIFSRVAGRKEELHTLEKFYSSDNPEFLALYGRRRIGKTFLIRSFFEGKDAIFFDVTGSKDGTLAEQLKHFTQQVGKIFYKGARLETGKNWDETFELLTEAIGSIIGAGYIIA